MVRTLVVVQAGPAGERGWLGLRTALALGIDGGPLTVALLGDAAQLALLTMAPPWFGGDPRRELRSLVDDLGCEVLVDAAALTAVGVGAEALAEGCVVADGELYARRLAEATRLIAV